MHFKPSRLEARVALNGDHELVARQIGVITADDSPFAWLTSLFGGGDDTDTDTQTTTRIPRTTTTRAVTITDPNTIPTNTRTTASTPTPTTTPQPRTTAQVATTPPPQIIQPTQQFVTTTSTSTSASVPTGNADTSQTNANSTSNGGLPSVVVGIIVAASVIFGLILIALIARKIFQSRRRNRRTTWAAATGVTPFDAPITEKALPPPPPTENQAYPSIKYPAYPPIAVAGMTSYNPSQPYSPAAASSTGYPAPYPFGTNGNAPPLMQQNYSNTTTAALFTAADLAGPVVIQHTPPTPTAAAAGAAVSVVKRTFVPSLPDELSINNGDQVRILSAYDDGWALCEKVSSGEKGVVPQECLEMAKLPSAGASTTGSEESRLNRNSSLRRGQDQNQ